MKSVSQIYKYDTDLDNQTATIVFDPALDLVATLNSMAEKSAQMVGWTFQ